VVAPGHASSPAFEAGEPRSAVSTEVVRYAARMPPPWLATNTIGTARGRDGRVSDLERVRPEGDLGSAHLGPAARRSARATRRTSSAGAGSGAAARPARRSAVSSDSPRPVRCAMPSSPKRHASVIARPSRFTHPGFHTPTHRAASAIAHNSARGRRPRHCSEQAGGEERARCRDGEAPDAVEPAPEGVGRLSGRVEDEKQAPRDQQHERDPQSPHRPPPPAVQLARPVAAHSGSAGELAATWSWLARPRASPVRWSAVKCAATLSG